MSNVETEPQDLQQKPDPLRNAVGSACHRLQDAYLSADGSAAHHAARAALAELRRGAAIDIEQNPLALEQTIFATHPDLEEKLVGHGPQPSPSERAAYTALTLFAVHMQSASRPMHRPGISFASACGRLNAVRESASIKPRVDAMLLAGTEKARLVHVRSLVTLLRSEEIGFDYGRFARDIRDLMMPKKRPGVQLQWGRDFAMGFFASGSSQSHANQSN